MEITRTEKQENVIEYFDSVEIYGEITKWIIQPSLFYSMSFLGIFKPKNEIEYADKLETLSEKI